MKNYILILVFIFSGIIYSQNYWQRVDTLENIPPGYTVQSLQITKNGYIYAPVSGKGVLRSTNNGQTWDTINSGLTIGQINSFAEGANGVIYLCVHWDNSIHPVNGGIFKSTNFGSSWVKTYQPSTVSADDNYLFVDDSSNIFRCHITTDSKGHQYPGYSFSSDNMNTWYPVTGLANGLNTSFLAVSNVVKENMYAWVIVGSQANFFKSIDRGRNWVNITPGLRVPSISSIMLNSFGHIFMLYRESGIYRSLDNGLSWTPYDNLLGRDLYINSMLIDSGNHIFAGSSYWGVYMSIDYAQNWQKLTGGISNDSVKSLALSPSGYLFAVTNSGGIFRSKDIATNIKSNPIFIKEFTLSQNYPNPFNPNTTITYSIPERGNVKLTVYNSLGQVISELVNEEKPAGNFSVQFNAANLPSGVYFYSLKSGGFVESKKLILLK